MAIIKNNHRVGIRIEDLFLNNMLYSPYMYEQQLIKFIARSGESNTLVSVNDMINHMGETFKIEGVEKLSDKLHGICRKLADAFEHNGAVTCHLFVAEAGTGSFPMHTDPDDVLMYVVEGSKTIELEDEVIILNAGDSLFLSKNTPHKAINEQASTMLSFGFERFLIDKILP